MFAFPNLPFSSFIGEGHAGPALDPARPGGPSWCESAARDILQQQQQQQQQVAGHQMSEVLARLRQLEGQVDILHRMVTLLQQTNDALLRLNSLQQQQKGQQGTRKEKDVPSSEVSDAADTSDAPGASDAADAFDGQERGEEGAQRGQVPLAGRFGRRAVS